MLPVTEADSGSSSIVSLCSVLSPDVGQAGDTLGDIISLELPTCNNSDLLRARLLRTGEVLARLGLSQELAMSLCLGCVASGLWRRSGWSDRRWARGRCSASDRALETDT